MDSEERIQAASNFLLQSPPGEINDVLNDVRNIISDDDSLQSGVLPALRQYNLEQFITADVPGQNHQCIVSEAARAPASEEEKEENGSERFWDPRSHTSFRFDHLSLEASDPVVHDIEPEPFREALQQASLNYLLAHYTSGVSSVFSIPDAPDQYTIQVVANKYNPTNFWSGRWRSEYRVNLAERTLEGKILVNVHYYEQGNVQLSTTYNVSLSLPQGISASTTTSAAKILALIESEESKYQNALADAYAEMGDQTFKRLRRTLPMTRQKLDWDKVLGYKLGAELTSNKSTFGTGSG